MRFLQINDNALYLKSGEHFFETNASVQFPVKY